MLVGILGHLGVPGSPRSWPRSGIPVQNKIIWPGKVFNIHFQALLEQNLSLSKEFDSFKGSQMFNLLEVA